MDGSHVRRCMEIDRALFETFDRFELDDLSFMNEVDNHYEQSEQTEISLNKRAITPQEPVEETVTRKIEVDKLYEAIAKLPDTQRRRLTLYYFGDFTYQQIAEMEGCAFQVAARSIKAAEKNLKKFLTGG